MHEVLQQLEAVGALQRHLLPRTIPRLAGWDLAIHYKPGYWPGGDYYDFFPLPDKRLMFLVADAGDRGPAAVALASMLRVVLHSCPLSSGVEQLPFCPFRDPLIQPPHLILGHLNRVLFENSLVEQFMAAFSGVLSPADGELRYACAGHLPPRWWRSAKRTVEPLPDNPGLPLGLAANSSYHHKRTDLDPGDVLVLCSGGLTSARNAQEQAFGWERLDDAVRHGAPEGAVAVKETVVSRLNEFLDGKPAQDDVTLLVLEKRG
jgi:sigma-B regulation protein RsbU (phosphoserine phosphatase)